MSYIWQDKHLKKSCRAWVSTTCETAFNNCLVSERGCCSRQPFSDLEPQVIRGCFDSTVFSLKTLFLLSSRWPQSNIDCRLASWETSQIIACLLSLVNKLSSREQEMAENVK